jgi:hypothetical protein
MTETPYARYRRKANQAWDMAGLAFQDGDTADGIKQTNAAKEFERLALEEEAKTMIKPNDTREFNDAHCDCRLCTASGEPTTKETPPPVSLHRTPWAVNCRKCGMIHLSHHEYVRQMRPLCVCPNCGEAARWSEEEYDAYGEVLQDAYERELVGEEKSR